MWIIFVNTKLRKVEGREDLKMKGVVKTNFCYKGTNKDLERSRIRFVVRVFVELEEE